MRRQVEDFAELSKLGASDEPGLAEPLDVGTVGSRFKGLWVGKASGRAAGV